LIRGWQGPLIVGALLRVSAWASGLWSGGWVQTDTPQYWGLASDGLAAYHATDGPLYALGLMRPPGYPAILAASRLVFDNYAGAALLQIGFGLAAIVLTYALGRRVADPSVAAVAAWWLALSPLHLVESSVLLTEIPFSAFMLGAAVLVSPWVAAGVVEWWRWAVAGLLLGIAILIRPIALYLPLVVVLATALAPSPRRLRIIVAGLVLLAGAAVPVGGWMARNHELTGVATVSTIEGTNLAFYRAAGAIAVEDRIPLEEAQRGMAALVDARTDPAMNPAEIARVEARIGVREILEHPLGYGCTALRGLILTLFGPARSHFIERFQATPLDLLTRPLVVLSALSAALLACLSVAGATIWVRARAWRSLWVVGLPILYLLAIGSGQEAWARFRMPLEPFLVVLAAPAIVRGTRILRKGVILRT
jgi:4-amino-4-deoxy-L-arabinose transferase-like glycosyltransferase